MKLKPGMSALVTGGGSGIGKGLCIALAHKGLFVTIVDFSEENGRQVASLVQKEASQFHGDSKVPSAISIKCDVTDADALAAAFEKHVHMYGGLDVCINCAGFISKSLVYDDTSNGINTWRRSINVNLVAVVDGTRIATQIMRAQKKPGAVLNIGSVAGLYPMHYEPIYSGTKGGVVMFTRSLAPLKRHGIRVNVLCPEFVETNMGGQVSRVLIDALGGFLKMEDVVTGAFELIEDVSKAGACLWISKRRGMVYWPTSEEEKSYLVYSSKSKKTLTKNVFLSIQTPEFFEKIVAHTLSHNFRNATRIDRVRLRLPMKPHSALVKIIYAGVNASDVNFTSGRYFSGNAKEASAHLPFDVGFEAVGIVASVGDSVKHIKVGTAVALMTFGGYAEFTLVPAKNLLPVPRPDPEVVAMLTSGLTASISLEKSGQMTSGQVVLVTAAAGGTGQFAVQLAKLAGNKVVATCGGASKAALLASLGVDRVINYQHEKIKDVLKKEFPRGADIIYESVGGDMFDLCLNALAVHGRLIVIGMISQYQADDGWTPRNYNGLCEKILGKSQTVAGFFLIQYADLWQKHLDKLFDLYASRKLKVSLDPKKFIGVASVADAVEYLHSGKSVGKVVVCIDPAYSQTLAKL
ncbi:prostaglandin reductase-3-like [Lolium rigidum]|uniref:prostaglandin reductase-3-like n=1 Tax=Lolium rigidum TaxID=89674 RepID=UPI001F5E22FF|nr:prostaglandin reductase-3-like [Lolium rigidum]